MTDFNSMLETDAKQHLIALGATELTHTDETGTTSPVYTLVEYNALNQQGYGYSPSVDVYFPANDTDGYASVVIGRHKIAIKGRQSDSATKDYILQQLVSQDAGIWHFIIQVQG